MQTTWRRLRALSPNSKEMEVGCEATETLLHVKFDHYLTPSRHTDASHAPAGLSSYSQSQHNVSSLYRNPNASMQYSQSQSQSHAKHKEPTTQEKNGNYKSTSSARKQSNPKKAAAKKDEDDGSATEGSETEHSDVDVDADKTMQSSVTSANHKPSLISDDKPIEDFERLVEQGGHMTSTAVKQCECASPFHCARTVIHICVRQSWKPFHASLTSPQAITTSLSAV